MYKKKKKRFQGQTVNLSLVFGRNFIRMRRENGTITGEKRESSFTRCMYIQMYVRPDEGRLL